MIKKIGILLILIMMMCNFAYADIITFPQDYRYTIMGNEVHYTDVLLYAVVFVVALATIVFCVIAIKIKDKRSKIRYILIVICICVLIFCALPFVMPKPHSINHRGDWTADISIFNAGLKQYCGTNRSQQMAKALIDLISNSNVISSKQKVRVAVIDETSIPKENHASDHSSTIRDDAQIIESRNDEVAIKIYEAHNARWNIFYHKDDSGYVDSIEFYLQYGNLGPKVIKEPSIVSGDTIN